MLTRMHCHIHYCSNNTTPCSVCLGKQIPPLENPEVDSNDSFKLTRQPAPSTRRCCQYQWWRMRLLPTAQRRTPPAQHTVHNAHSVLLLGKTRQWTDRGQLVGVVNCNMKQKKPASSITCVIAHIIISFICSSFGFDEVRKQKAFSLSPSGGVLHELH